MDRTLDIGIYLVLGVAYVGWLWSVARFHWGARSSPAAPRRAAALYQFTARRLG